MYDSIELGEYIATMINSKGYFINQTKLQKLMYIIYGTYLCLNDGAKLTGESPKAWPYGPVFPRVQKKFAKSQDYMCADLTSEKYSKFKENEKLNNIINNALITFGSWSALQLSQWSHEEGSPWAIAFENNNFKYNGVIDDKDIIDYFKNIIEDEPIQENHD